MQLRTAGSKIAFSFVGEPLQELCQDCRSLTTVCVLQLKKYQEVMSSITQRNAFSGDAHPDANEAQMIEEATKALMTTVKSVPELRAQKKKLDSHMNLLYTLLQSIKDRTLDKCHELGQSVLAGTALVCPWAALAHA